FKDEVARATRGSLEAAHKLYHDDIAALVYRDPAERVPQTVKKVIERIDDRRMQLDKFDELLGKHLLSPDEEIQTAARRGKSYATKLAGVLDRAKQALNAGKRWTDEEKTETEDDLQQFRGAWQEALEALGVD